MSDYCPARHDDTPGHACLCVKDTGHRREHLCLCGYMWHTDWGKLSYDQQRQMLGLPPRPITMDDLKVAILASIVMGDLPDRCAEEAS
ncbi:hypothetical protein M1M07_24590 [Rhodococcus sp. HM1]|uniref:hypothetical protein n=1 Tax=Rhodococcus sp. HM1 TaxID=2937759 RepID=UPI00200A5DB7|nr:hypothetical protein [Rhodococcus sp. HM1]MCK8674278.1 hypothetical protein [Rhodococcus sp. HM1]